MKDIFYIDVYLCAKTFIMQFHYEIQIIIIQFIMQLHNDIYSIYIYIHTHIYEKDIFYIPQMNISGKKE